MKIKTLNTQTKEAIQKEYKVSSLCAKILSSKNLTTEEMDSILRDESTLSDLNLFFLTPIVERIRIAKKNKEKILVCGDYDCDGICATTIMYDSLIQFGIQSGYYIPNRFKEGYGLNVNTVKLAKEKNYSILITVDNGVKSKEALQLAKSYGIEIILSDHHRYDEEDLVCDYFLHPAILEKQFQGMCGAGLAYLLSRALIGYNEKHLILACVATIGDIVPLLNVNRTIVKEGIDLLNQGKFFAIQSLQNDTQKWNAKKIAFQIVPKLNCVGRLADRANANTLVPFLCSENSAAIQNMSVQIKALNEERKKLSNSMQESASSLLKDTSFQILYDESFHEGINGIVASKLVNTLQQPIMVLSNNNSILKGSVRSNSVDLSNFFNDYQEKLISYGGHKEAAGIAFHEDKLESLMDYVNEKMKYVDTEKEIECLEVRKEEINFNELESLSILEPFGCGFDLPYFMIKDSDLDVKTLSNGKHLKYVGNSISYLYFDQGRLLEVEKKKQFYTFIGKLEISYFRNIKSINMIVDYRVD